MKHEFSDDVSAAALVLDAEIRIPHEAQARATYPAKIDTGADICVVPRKFVRRFKPLAFNTFRIRQTDKREHSYLLQVVIEGQVYPVEAIAHDAHYALIGRDNQCTLISDGPGQRFELLHPTN